MPKALHKYKVVLLVLLLSSASIIAKTYRILQNGKHSFNLTGIYTSLHLIRLTSENLKTNISNANNSNWE